MQIILRITAFLLVLTLFSAGCQSHEPGTVRIALVAKAMDSEFWLSVKTGAEQAAAQHPNVRLDVLAPQREINIDEQVNILEDLMVRGVDALIVAPSGVSQIIPVLDRIHQKGIPVIIVDTDIEWNDKLAYVGTDNALGGRMAAQFLNDTLDGKGRIAVIRGIPGVASQDSRVAGFLEEIQRHPGLEVAANQPANSERSLAMSVMENVLSANPQLDAIFATSDEMALGAVEAIQSRRLAGNLIVVGFDGGSEAVKAMQEGKIQAIVAQNPARMGELSVEAALRALAGEPLEKTIDSGTKLLQ